MNAYTNIASVPAPAIEWLFANWPGLGVVAFIIWLSWRYFTWVNNKFEDMSTDIKQSMTAVINDKIDNQNERLDLKFAIVDQRFIAMDQKFTAKFEAVDRRFDEVERRFGEVDRR